MSDSFQLQSLALCPAGGRAITLRLHLPPNLPAAAKRDAIAVKLELLDESGDPLPLPSDRINGKVWGEPPHLLALALVESWCGGVVPPLMQLTRSQLGQLLAPLTGQAAIGWVNRPGQLIEWAGGALPGVHEHLAETPAKPAAPAAKSAGATRNRSPDTRDTYPKTRDVSPKTHDTDGRHAPAREPRPPEVDGSTQFISIALPDRDHPAYRDLADLVKAEGFKLDARLRRYFLRGRHQAMHFLAKHYTRLRDGFGVRFTDNFRQRAEPSLKTAELDIRLQRTSGGAFEVDARLHAPGIDDRALWDALSKGQPYAEAADGSLVLLDCATLDRLTVFKRKMTGDDRAEPSPVVRARVRPEELPFADAALREVSSTFKPVAEWAERARAFRERDALQPAPIAADLNQRLRPYQRTGVAWLWHLFGEDLAGILADEMGLGKTVQALAALSAIARRHPRLPLLVVCPASLVENWCREAATFCPDLAVLRFHGPDRPRSLGTLETGTRRLVITSYATLARDREQLRTLKFGAVVADEAQHVKNRAKPPRPYATLPPKAVSSSLARPLKTASTTFTRFSSS